MYTRIEIVEMLINEIAYYHGGDERAKQRLIDFFMKIDTAKLISEFTKHTGIVLESLGFQDMFRIVKSYNYRAKDTETKHYIWY